MSKNFATHLEFECADWGCKRQATEVKVGANVEADEVAAQFRRGLVCSIHRGAAKRQMNGRWGSYYQFVFLPITDIRFAVEASAYLAERLTAHNEAIEAANIRRREVNLEAQSRFAQAWVERSTEGDFRITRGTDFRSYDDRYRDGYKVQQQADDDNWFRGTEVRVEQDGRMPATVGLSTTGRWSPAEARAVAQALMLAANLADERDITNGPE